MDNAQKAIMIGVGLFITIIVIAAVMTITGIGQDLLNQGQSQLSGISGQLQTQLQTQYDQVKLSGSLVKAAINKYYNDATVVVGLCNTVGTVTNPTFICASGMTPAPTPTGTTSSTVTEYTVASPTVSELTTKIPLSSFSTTSNASYYISPTSQYRSVLIKRSDTGAVLGIVFVRYQ